MMVDPLPKREPICESDLVRVFDELGSNLYRVEVKTPDSTLRIFDGVRAYTDSMGVDSDGRITMAIRAKTNSVRSGMVLYPYHYLCGERVLCALKMNCMRIKSEDEEACFALNYDLFCLQWETCLLVTKGNGDGCVYAASRQEWDRGELNIHNQEVQMFLRLGPERCVPVRLARAYFRKEIVSWMDSCVTEMNRKIG